MTSDSKSALKSNVESLISDGNEAHAGLILVSEDVEFFKLQGYQFCYSENNTHALESEVKTTLKKNTPKKQLNSDLIVMVMLELFVFCKQLAALL